MDGLINVEAFTKANNSVSKISKSDNLVSNLSVNSTNILIDTIKNVDNQSEKFVNEENTIFEDNDKLIDALKDIQKRGLF